jgi:NADH-quinone oxidoreductase subunit A
MFLGISTVIGIALLVIGGLLGPRRPGAEKDSPYECGFEAFEDTRMKFDVRFYLIAILFIIFDLEIAFFIPWAVALDSLGMFGLVAMLVFVVELVIGYVFAWKRGALEWE